MYIRAIFSFGVCNTRTTLDFVLSGLAGQRKRQASGGRGGSWRVSLPSRRNYVKSKMRSETAFLNAVRPTVSPFRQHFNLVSCSTSHLVELSIAFALPPPVLRFHRAFAAGGGKKANNQPATSTTTTATHKRRHRNSVWRHSWPTDWLTRNAVGKRRIKITDGNKKSESSGADCRKRKIIKTKRMCRQCHVADMANTGFGSDAQPQHTANENCGADLRWASTTLLWSSSCSWRGCFGCCFSISSLLPRFQSRFRCFPV